MSLENLKIWVSPVTGIIYAGYLDKSGNSAKSKVDVTQQVSNAMMQYMHSKGEKHYLECPVGKLKFIPVQEDDAE